jgi:hypothetical protein
MSIRILQIQDDPLPHPLPNDVADPATIQAAYTVNLDIDGRSFDFTACVYMSHGTPVAHCSFEPELALRIAEQCQTEASHARLGNTILDQYRRMPHKLPLIVVP